MTQFAQISCIRKSDRFSPHERIQSVGGISPDGTRWYLSLDEAVSLAASGKWKFFVREFDNLVWVKVVTSPAGNRFLKTESDKTTSNNLLSLPECPVGGLAGWVPDWGRTPPAPRR